MVDQEQLRGELGFKGAVITDDFSMVGAAVVGTVEERVRRALDAGCDLVLLCNAPQQVPGVLEALQGYVNPTLSCAWRVCTAAAATLGRVARVRRVAKARRRSRRSARVPSSSSRDELARAAAAERTRSSRGARRARSIPRATSRRRSRGWRTRSARGSPARIPVVLAVMQAARSRPSSSAASRSRTSSTTCMSRVTRRHAGGAIDWRVRPSAALAGRTVLIVDDILDRGHTLRALQAELAASALRRAHGRARREAIARGSAARPRVDFVGVEVDDVYVFGCGMDYRATGAACVRCTRSTRSGGA